MPLVIAWNDGTPTMKQSIEDGEALPRHAVQQADHHQHQDHGRSASASGPVKQPVMDINSKLDYPATLRTSNVYWTNTRTLQESAPSEESCVAGRTRVSVNVGKEPGILDYRYHLKNVEALVLTKYHFPDFQHGLDYLYHLKDVEA